MTPSGPAAVSPPKLEGESLAELRASVVELLRNHGLEYRETPFQLSSGKLSHDYIDGKRALGTGDHLELVCKAAVALATERRVSFDAVGGLTMGADALAHGISLLTGCAWFSVRKEPKEHGKQRQVEGTKLAPGTPVLLVDDVVTTGSSILKAIDAVQEAGASVELAIAICDRGEAATRLLGQRGVPYEALATYRDLAIEPVAE